MLRKIFRNLANDLWQLEPEVVFQWGRFYFRGQPLYHGRLSAPIHFVISRSLIVAKGSDKEVHKKVNKLV